MQKIVARRRKSFLYFCIDINILDNQMITEIVKHYLIHQYFVLSIIKSV